ncbi:MAG: NAD(P)H-hydrate dehydratase [Actinomycetota bacterium]
MKPILTPKQSAELDAAAEARGITTESLMENAGRAVAEACVTATGGAYGRRAVVLCGKGNNGGDGMVAARLLEREGMRTTTLLLEDPSSMREPAVTNHERLLSETDRVRHFSETAADRELGRADVAIDAIFGTGFHGVPDGMYASAIGALNSSGTPVVAVDIPSGVDGESAMVAGDAVRADVTVSLGTAKPGVILFPGTEFAGIVEVADIGIPPDMVASDLLLVEASDVSMILPVREPDTNKRATGVVMVIGGSRDMTGAVCLVAEAAFRTGAGLVTIAAPEGIVPVIQERVAEATYLPLPETPEGTVAADAFKIVWDRMGEFDAFALGPGLSRNGETAEFARGVAAAVPKALVLDADGLNAFEGRAGELADRGAPDLVLTPHDGEFARLSGIPRESIELRRVEAVRELAGTVQATVLLKGTRTLIGSLGGEVRINPTGNSALATAGSGDVLTGAIAALLARGLPAPDAAAAGAFVHGLAGSLAAADSGEGTTAGDLAERIPAAVLEVLSS